jgi:hypothetical protein
MEAHVVSMDTEIDTSEPDIWWGPDGIDGLLWADPPPPYADPLAAEAAKASLEPEAVR